MLAVNTFEHCLVQAINIIKKSRNHEKEIQCTDGPRIKMIFRDFHGYLNQIICYDVSTSFLTEAESIITSNAGKLWGVTITIHCDEVIVNNVSRGFLKDGSVVSYGLVDSEICFEQHRFKFSAMTTDTLRKIINIACPFNGISERPLYAMGYEGDDCNHAIDDTSLLTCIDRALIVSK